VKARLGHEDLRQLAESSRSMDHYPGVAPIGTDLAGMLAANRPVGIIPRDYRLDYVLYHYGEGLDLSQFGANVHEVLREETLRCHAGMLLVAASKFAWPKQPLPDYRFGLDFNVGNGLVREIVLNTETGKSSEGRCCCQFKGN